MLEIVKNKEFWRLPPANVRGSSEAADSCFIPVTEDSCVMRDRGSGSAESDFPEAGRNAEDAIIRDYAESGVAIADNQDCSPFSEKQEKARVLKRALARYSSGGAFGKAAANGMDAIQGISAHNCLCRWGQKLIGRVTVRI